MTHHQPDDFDDAEEAKEKMREILGRSESEKTVLTEDEMKREIQRFLRGDRKNDPRCDSTIVVETD